MTQQLEQYCEALIEKHREVSTEDLREDAYQEAHKHAASEVEGIIEALEKLSFLTPVEAKINFYKQALLKLKS